MKISFLESFERDIRSISDSRIQKQLKKLILRLEAATSLAEVPNIKRLVGGKDFYRVRLGEYRIGFTCNQSEITLVRVLHRKEIYRYFP